VNRLKLEIDEVEQRVAHGVVMPTTLPNLSQGNTHDGPWLTVSQLAADSRCRECGSIPLRRSQAGITPLPDGAVEVALARRKKGEGWGTTVSLPSRQQ
jgi:hypothetical protein